MTVQMVEMVRNAYQMHYVNNLTNAETPDYKTNHVMGKGRNTIPMTRTQMGAAMQSCPTWTW